MEAIGPDALARAWSVSLMYDLAAIAIGLACFAFFFLLLDVLDRV